MRCVTRAAAAALFLFSCVVVAQSGGATYPTKPVRMVVTFTPGGATDVIGRIVAQKLTELSGQHVIVDNRPGTGGALSTELVAKAAPDGYTILLSRFGPMAIAPSSIRSSPTIQSRTSRRSHSPRQAGTSWS